MPTSAAHGKHGAAKAAGATLPVRKWSAEHEAPARYTISQSKRLFRQKNCFFLKKWKGDMNVIIKANCVKYERP